MIEPAELHDLPDADLKALAAHVAGALAHRFGWQESAAIWRNIGAALEKTFRRALA